MKYNNELLNKMSKQIDFFKKGGIYIKPKNRGKFTEYCGGKVTEECIRRGKNSKDPKIRKRANFAANARKWKHQKGGIIKPTFEEWYTLVPKSKNDTISYNLRRAYELAPWEELNEFAKNLDAHLNSFYWNEDGVGEFMKRFDHPTLNLELKEYYNNPYFNSRYFLDTSGEYYRYVPKHKIKESDEEN